MAYSYCSLCDETLSNKYFPICICCELPIQDNEEKRICEDCIDETIYLDICYSCGVFMDVNDELSFCNDKDDETRETIRNKIIEFRKNNYDFIIWQLEEGIKIANLTIQRNKKHLKLLRGEDTD